MRPFVLTRQAETALQDIARWTANTFGPRQARLYGQELIDGCTALAGGRAQSRPCRRLIDPALPEDLRFARVGQHFIVFIDAPERITIVDVLHVRADLPRRLAALGDDAP
uniref:type II toxin-antitoxin system RelE/ParE family toxin n=1 Tax=Mameliella sp. TaxID=1924940 RepID=UPI003C79747E